MPICFTQLVDSLQLSSLTNENFELKEINYELGKNCEVLEITVYQLKALFVNFCRGSRVRQKIRQLLLRYFGSDKLVLIKQSTLWRLNLTLARSNPVTVGNLPNLMVLCCNFLPERVARSRFTNEGIKKVAIKWKR